MTTRSLEPLGAFGSIQGGVASWRVAVHQTRALALANLKARYRKTIAGFVWVVANPILIVGAQSYAFYFILKIDLPNYPLFLMAGLVPWIFISQTLEMCTPILLVSGPLLKAFPVHPLVVIAAQLVDNFTNFVVAFVLILIPVWLVHPVSAVGLMLAVPALASLAVAVFSMSVILAMVQVFFRDTRYIVNLGISIAFFLTPIFYPIELVPYRYRLMARINPFHHLLEPFRHSLYVLDLAAYAGALGVSSLLSASLLLAAVLYWRKQRDALYLNF